MDADTIESARLSAIWDHNDVFVALPRPYRGGYCKLSDTVAERISKDRRIGHVSEALHALAKAGAIRVEPGSGWDNPPVWIVEDAI